MIVTATKDTQKDGKIFVIYSQRYQYELEIHGYALSREEAIRFCREHDARYPYAPQYRYFEAERICDKEAGGFGAPCENWPGPEEGGSKDG